MYMQLVMQLLLYIIQCYRSQLESIGYFDLNY